MVQLDTRKIISSLTHYCSNSIIRKHKHSCFFICLGLNSSRIFAALKENTYQRNSLQKKIKMNLPQDIVLQTMLGFKNLIRLLFYFTSVFVKQSIMRSCYTLPCSVSNSLRISRLIKKKEIPSLPVSLNVFWTFFSMLFITPILLVFNSIFCEQIHDVH